MSTKERDFFFPSQASFVDRNNPGHAETMVLLMVDLKKARKKVLSAPLILMRKKLININGKRKKNQNFSIFFFVDTTFFRVILISICNLQNL